MVLSLLEHLTTLLMVESEGLSIVAITTPKQNNAIGDQNVQICYLPQMIYFDQTYTLYRHFENTRYSYCTLYHASSCYY